MKQIILALILVLGFGLSVFAQNELAPCPAINVSGNVGETSNSLSFSVALDEKAKNYNLEYLWTVSQGTIIEGQGTSAIKVDITGFQSFNVTATVELKGLPETCQKTASETAGVIRCFLPISLVDMFGNMPRNEVKARIDALFFRLKDEINSQIYIINYGTDAEIANRESQIRDAMTFRKYDVSRVTLVRGGANPDNEKGVLTKAWIVPPGGEIPEP